MTLAYFVGRKITGTNSDRTGGTWTNLAAGWIGGLLPLIVTWLNQKWGNDIVGLWYPTIFLASAAILALLYLPETKKIDLRI